MAGPSPGMSEESQTEPRPVEAHDPEHVARHSRTVERTVSKEAGNHFQMRTGSPSKSSFSSSLNQNTPARSYFHHALDSHPSTRVIHNSARNVREDTAELASWALSDITTSQRKLQLRNRRTSSTHNEIEAGERGHDEGLGYRISNDSSHPKVIIEVSESSPPEFSDALVKSSGASALTRLLREPFPDEGRSTCTSNDDAINVNGGLQPAIVNQGIISQPSERTALSPHKSGPQISSYGSLQAANAHKTIFPSRIGRTRVVAADAKAGVVRICKSLVRPKVWNKQAIWTFTVRRPLGYVPPILLGLLLNILDALSYGMILFPLGEPIFASLGPDGISMFYVSCIVAQLVYSCGGSMFRGGVGSEMIEVVPFFHKMAFTILAHVGRDNPKAVIATTVLSYSVSSIFTGAVFYSMGKFKIGALIGFFPRHILLGCIGGVGWFLVATGFEVSARLDGNSGLSPDSLKKLFESDTVVLWIIPLGLAILLNLIKKRIYNHALTDATFFLSIIAIFYWFVWAIPELTLPQLRSKGWVFEAPKANVPFYHFYELYDFDAVDWQALGKTVPAMLALTFFGILHVPINIPALGLSMEEDNVDLDRELRAHGVSNALSGFLGSIQNYLVYTNTLLFVRSGGNDRLAGILLAVATFGILVIGPGIVGYIPIMVVGTLIFFLGLELLTESLVSTWGKLDCLEYFTIVVIVVVMGAWDFVTGILAGILLACISFVLQTSQISAVRGKLYGGVANSTVRRHPIQHRYLKDAGNQIHVMKLAGHLFFGTIVGVEEQIRTLLSASLQPIRFLVLDLYNVDGIDFSAAEAFARISRVLNGKGIQLVICGLAVDGKRGKSLSGVGLFSESDHVQYFQSLNSALEYCENELLRTLYYRKESDEETESSPVFLEVTRTEQSSLRGSGVVMGSPRQNQLHQVAANTLEEQNTSLVKWQNYRQPLQLILQTFSAVSGKDEDFWRPAACYFVRESHSAGSLLYRAGDPPSGFYLLESGMLKARYDFPQGKYSELIVAGTTCGELPFFSCTQRTATTMAETNCITWMLDQKKWSEMQQQEPWLAQEMLKISLKLTSERMDAITKYMLLTTG